MPVLKGALVTFMGKQIGRLDWASVIQVATHFGPSAQRGGCSNRAEAEERKSVADRIAGKLGVRLTRLACFRSVVLTLPRRELVLVLDSLGLVSSTRTRTMTRTRTRDEDEDEGRGRSRAVEDQRLALARDLD
jgi:hypothetical protein